MLRRLLSLKRGRRTRRVRLALGLSLVACRSTDSGSELTLASEQPIVFGRPSPSGTREDAIVMLQTEADEGELVCSAVLVADNLVLTARHCVSHAVRSGFECTIDGELVEDGSSAGSVGLHLPAAGLEFYSGDGDERKLIARGAEVLSTLSPTLCIDDLAFVVLDRSVALPFLPLRLERTTRIGEAVMLTGYGPDETMDFDTPFADLHRNTKDDLVVFDVGPKTAEEVTTAPPRTVMVRAPAGCVGDSGGPLYAKDTGAVIGVYSLLLGNSCTADTGFNLFTHVPDYHSLIDDAFAAAGREPLPEPEGHFGDPCESAADCIEGHCEDLGAGELACTRPCASDDDCEAGYACSSRSGGSCQARGGVAPASGGAAGSDPSGESGEAGDGPAPQPRSPHSGGGCALAVPSREGAAFGFTTLVCAAAVGRRPRRKQSRSARRT